MDIVTIRLWEPTCECGICEREGPWRHAVGWYCGPTQDEIGSVTTEYTDGGIVGGMCVCQPCHDDFYALSDTHNARTAEDRTHD